MTIYNIVLETDDIDKLSVHEICSLCIFVSDHIITYFKEVLMGYSIQEQRNLRQCQEIIQDIFGIYKNIRINPSEPDVDTNIEISEFTCIALKSDQKVDVLHMQLDPHCYHIEGPVALIKLWTSVVCTSLCSLKNKNVFLHPETFDSHTKCIIRTVNALYNILSPISINGKFTVDERTEFSSVVMTIGRTPLQEQNQQDDNLPFELVKS
jgi:hypothetical protein